MGVKLDLQYAYSWAVTMWFKKRTSYGVLLYRYTKKIHDHTLSYISWWFFSRPISPILMGTQLTWWPNCCESLDTMISLGCLRLGEGMVCANHRLCMCVYIYMFFCVYIITITNMQSDPQNVVWAGLLQHLSADT